MNRQSKPTPISIDPDWPVSGPDSALSSHNRWALVSTSISALIVGSIAWLAVGTMPPVSGGTVESAFHEFLPYRLFQQLTQGGSNALLASVAPVPQAAPADGDDGATAKRSSIETGTITLEAGDTLAGALQNAGVPAADVNAAIAALGKVQSLRLLRAGQTFDITYNTDPAAALPTDENGDDSAGPAMRLLTIKYSPSVEHDIAVVRSPEGGFEATDTVKQLVSQTHRAGATIDGSLYLSAMKAGIPSDVVAEMIRMFSYKVDFQRDVRAGDTFEVFYDYFYTPEGVPARQGNISYATMKLGSQIITLYRYQANPNDPAEYFDAKGASAKGLLMKTPVDGARITSGFGRRFHPVLGYSRMHKGVDFGVPVGTPVMAAGGGTVTFAGWSSGYGRFLMINHGNGYSTAYGHLSRFASGLHRGSRVRQAQIVAYSGNTGITTGPHLHYEIRVNNKQVNPLKVKMAQGRKLAGKELKAYQIARLAIDDKLAETKLETKIPDMATNLRGGGTK